MVRTSYQLTDTITLVDNRGCPKVNNFETAEIYAQLGNFLPLDIGVVWRESYSDVVSNLEQAEMEPNESDLIIPVFVYNVKHSIPEELIAELSSFITNCRLMTGVYPIIVLTNKHSADYLTLEKTFRRMRAEVVMTVENYTNEDHMKTLGRTTDILKFIDSALNNAKYLMEQPRNPKKDRIGRRLFLLNHIHDAKLAQQEEQIRKEEEQRAKRNQTNTSFWRKLFRHKQ